MRTFSDAQRVVMGMKPSEFLPVFSYLGIGLDHTLPMACALMKALSVVRETDRRDEFIAEVDKAVGCEIQPASDSVTISRELFNELVYEIPKAKNALAGAAHPYPSPYKEDLERLVLELKQAL
jgi:hypothetical protein